MRRFNYWTVRKYYTYGNHEHNSIENFIHCCDYIIEDVKWYL